MESGYGKASSYNLPEVDIDMVTAFFAQNLNYVASEVKNVKTKRSMNTQYGDNAIGYVQLKREGNYCTVKGRITPEHKVRNKPYHVEVVIDELEQKVVSSECKDCSASLGGCKHAVAFFFLWLYRRNEDPSVTSVTCYWKKAALSKLGEHKLDIDSIFGHSSLPSLPPKNLAYVIETIDKIPTAIGGIFEIFRDYNGRYEKLSLFHLMLNYKQDVNQYVDIDSFLAYAFQEMMEDLCSAAEYATRDQSKSRNWFELRYARITASKICEVSRCNTFKGSLTEALMGAAPPLETKAVLRGKKLENLVLLEVSKMRKIKIQRCGIYLNAQYPTLGASPDGISKDYCVEIKCPSSEKSITRYIKDGIISPPYYHQLLLQMYFCKKQQGLFCVASPKFEENKEVIIQEINFNQQQCDEVIEKAQKFWKNAIFPVLMA